MFANMTICFVIAPDKPLSLHLCLHLNLNYKHLGASNTKMYKICNVINKSTSVRIV